MSDSTSAIPGVVRGPDGTVATVTADGVAVQSRPLAAILEEIALVQRQMLGALLVLLHQHEAYPNTTDLENVGG